jgi:hypothetical protein
MVAMSVMAVFMAMVTGGVIQVFNAVNRNDSLAGAQAAVNLTFLRLDKEIRYAANISQAGAAGPGGADAAVDYLTTATGQSTNTYPDQCTELRLHDTTLQVTRWPLDSTPTDGTTLAWSTLATGVVSANPFTYVAAEGAFSYPRIELSMEVTFGGNDTATTRLVEVTFYALNVLPAKADDTVCTGIRGL